MTACLQAVGIGDIRYGSGIVCPYNVAKLTGKGIQRTVFMAFKTGDHLMGGSFPFIIKRLNEMA